jgi:hypothetical protein
MARVHEIPLDEMNWLKHKAKHLANSKVPHLMEFNQGGTTGAVTNGIHIGRYKVSDAESPLFGKWYVSIIWSDFESVDTEDEAKWLAQLIIFRHVKPLFKLFDL